MLWKIFVFRSQFLGANFERPWPYDVEFYVSFKSENLFGRKMQSLKLTSENKPSWKRVVRALKSSNGSIESARRAAPTAQRPLPATINELLRKQKPDWWRHRTCNPHFAASSAPRSGCVDSRVIDLVLIWKRHKRHEWWTPRTKGHVIASARTAFLLDVVCYSSNFSLAVLK